MENLLVAWLVSGCVVQLLANVVALWEMLRMPLLARLAPRQPDSWPRLSVIVPACNEGSTLEPAVRTLLAQDYPDLEVVLINDRSTDDTGAVVDRLAQDTRVVPVHIKDLPEGWLGKVHALHQGVQRASGAWLLFMDADVHQAPGALGQTVALSEERHLDHLTLLPTMTGMTFWAEVLVVLFGQVFMAASRPSWTRAPTSRRAVGVGAFNLVRRSVFDRSEGFPWLRMEVGDDMGLALLMKRAGARSLCVNGTGLFSIVWYPTLPAAVHGLEKNMFAVGARYSVARMVLMLAAILLIVPAPAMALVTSWWPLGLATLLFTVLLAGVGKRVLAVRFSTGLLAPAGLLIFAWIIMRSARACLRQGGITWRGTLYPLEELRANQRVKL